MKYRTALLLAPEDVQSAGTKVIDLDLTSPISRIDIRFKITKGSDGMVAGVPACLPRIEIVDGSERLVSLTGYELQALGYYNRPGRQLEHGQELTANSEEGHYPIDFGRFLWDPELAFDPTRFNNPQLRIQHSELLTDASASSNELEVTAEIFDEKAITPIGFLSAIEEFDYTLGADNSFEVISLPDDMAVRQMLLRAFYTGYEPWYSIDEARLDENNLEKIIFDYTNLENYVRMMKAVWSRVEVAGVWNIVTSERTFYVPATDYWAQCVLAGHGTAGNLTVTTDDLRGGKIGVTSSATGEFSAFSFGYLPWHCYQFPLGPPMEIEDWWDPKDRKPRLRLRASTATTNGIGQVVLEKLRRY